METIDFMIKRKQGGFTLVEVLTSMFVLALGVIGSAGMQLTALRTAQQSAFQTAALQLASEMADKMRANGHQSGLDELNPFLDIDYASATDAAPAPGTLCYAAGCSAEELAKFDIDEWKTRVKAALPGGRVRICRDSNPWDSAAGAFTWGCTPAATGANTAALVIKIGWQGKGSNPDGSAVKDAGKDFPPGIAVTVASYAK